MTQKRSQRDQKDVRRRALATAVALTASGSLHFALPQQYDEIVPTVLPGEARFWTYASGVAELATAALLFAPKSRRLGGAAAAALFLAVFPANVQMAWNWRERSLPWQVVAYGRLPLQIPMIRSALKIWRNA